MASSGSGADNSQNRPIVVKKVKKGGGGHHGGSWKVAYADFVTAMMAFFILMWLLASLEQSSKEQVANYFKRPLKAIFTQGNYSGGDRIQASSQGTATPGMMAPGGENGEYDPQGEFEQFKAMLETEMGKNAILDAFKDLIQVEQTENGIRLSILDTFDEPMFASGSAVMQPFAKGLLRELARIINEMPNRITVSGHTDASPFVGGDTGYSNWELSTDRANSARRELVAGGLAEDKVVCIEGLAHRMNVNKGDPFDPVNRRISILLLNPTGEMHYIRDESDREHQELAEGTDEMDVTE